jgi:hypothetical protein
VARQLWVAALFVLLGACAPVGYVYDAGGSSNRHPSAALCASWGQRLDTSVNEDGQCVLAPAAPSLALQAPALPPPPPQTAPAAPRRIQALPAPRAAERVAAVERDDGTYNELKSEARSGLLAPARESNYRCGTLGAMRTVQPSQDFKLVCHGARCCLLPHFHR